MNSIERDILACNWHDVQQRVRAASERAGRNAADVQLIAVTKYAEPDWMRGLYELGCREFGESRPQQLIARAAEFPPDVRWHLVGHLQRNKAAAVWPAITWMHSLDSLRLAEKLSEIATKSDHKPSILLEVNVSGESTKGGFSPHELRSIWPRLRDLTSLSITGLMTMAPETDDANIIRSVFRGLRELRDELQSDQPLPQLSMGMSGDYEIAIEEGATLIRIGSRLFDGLSAPNSPPGTVPQERGPG